SGHRHLPAATEPDAARQRARPQPWGKPVTHGAEVIAEHLFSDPRSRYSRVMSRPTAASLRLRAALVQHVDRVAEAMGRYGATNPRLFGSVARGNAHDDSDLDLIVDLVP